MSNSHVVTDGDGELDYVEYYIECNNTVVQLHPDEGEESGWRVEETVVDDDERWSKPK